MERLWDQKFVELFAKFISTITPPPLVSIPVFVIINYVLLGFKNSIFITLICLLFAVFFPVLTSLILIKKMDTDLDITDVASKLEINFDLSVNKTLTVSGNAFINISLGISIGGGGASVSNLRVKYTFYKVATDGSTETAISSQIESNKVSSSSNSVFRLLTKVPITRTVLKKGEKLRLEVQIWGSRSVGTASSGYFYHDGSNRITGTSGGISYGSTLLVQLPIKIEL